MLIEQGGSTEQRRSTDAESFEATVEPDSWVLSYVDLLLLMVTLFVLLLSYQQQVLKKTQEDASKLVLEPAVLEPAVKVKPILLDQVYINDLKGKVSFLEENNQVRLAMSDQLLFLPGDAALSRSGELVLDELAVMLNVHPSKILVEGHTDNQVISTPRFQSNWELSSARASSVTRHLIGKGVSPIRLSAIGYADTRPIQGNASRQGRKENRRVELVLTVPE